ncbi:MAG: UGMP family protein [Candidatus Aenigmatarchaeota archaeon]|nr:MAG: UGMP family protein [Candidatus Aenigmarchaeota archaeon]
MKVIGIESTAHTFGIGVVDEKFKVLADERTHYTPKEGIIPLEAAQSHEKNAPKLLKKIEDKIDLKEIGLIGLSSGPGLAPCLYHGLNFVKDLSKKLRKPLVGINHCQAHIEIGKILTKLKSPITLYVSGGNTQIIYENKGYKILGETQDIGIGNAIDKLGRVAGLSFPAGPKIEKIAKKGNFVMLPYSVKGMDLNFSGILSESIRKLEKGESKEDIFYSFQEVCFAMLTEITERAIAATEKKELLLVGGVAQNNRLQEMLKIMCKDRGAKFEVVPKEFAGDNGTMIAMTALVNYKNKEIGEIEIKPNWRVDTI